MAGSRNHHRPAGSRRSGSSAARQYPRAARVNESLREVLADALVRSPAGTPPALTAASADGRVEIRIIDRGADPGDGPDSLAFRLACDLADARDHPVPGGRDQGAPHDIAVP